MYGYGAPPPPQPPPPPYGAPPHGSWYPPQGGWGQPSAPPPPRKSSPFIPIVIAVSVLTLGSCMSVCGFAMYRAQTPEGRAEAQAKDDADRAALAAFVTKLEKLRSSIPEADAEDEPCPAGTIAKNAPIVDSYYLDAIATREVDEEQMKTSALVRDAAFSDTILNAVAQRDAGQLFGGVGFAVIDADQLRDKPYVLVVAVDDAAAPDVKGSTFDSGELTGRIVLFDWKSETAICHTSIKAESSDEVSYGGGVRMKVKGVPLPAMGSTDLADAVNKDFKANVRAAIHDGLKSLGGE